MAGIKGGLLEGSLKRTKPKSLVPKALSEDEKEAAFVTLVCNGMSLAEAYRQAGFVGNYHNASARLWDMPRIQEQANAILKARAATSPVTLADVTDMLKQVFAGALADHDFSPAHNAAFSLARLYGLVIDRAQISDLRRPSRDPDAPAEQALGDWVQSLPALPAPSQAPLEPQAPSPATLEAAVLEGDLGPLRGARAVPYGEPSTNQPESLSVFNGLAAEPPGPGPEPSEPFGLAEGPSLASHYEILNEFKHLAGPEPWDSTRVGAGEIENGAPAAAVTGTPNGGARTGHKARVSNKGSKARKAQGPITAKQAIKLAEEKIVEAGGRIKKKVPRKKKRVPAPKRVKSEDKPLPPGVQKRLPKRLPKPPSEKDLFG